MGPDTGLFVVGKDPQATHESQECACGRGDSCSANVRLAMSRVASSTAGTQYASKPSAAYFVLPGSLAVINGDVE